MMTMQVFFDYECPYCKKGYEYLMEQSGKFPEIEIELRPIESHPLPEDHPPHTHLACQSFYIAKELEADMLKFHAAMFKAVAIERQNVEKPEVLCNILKGIVDTEKFRTILESRKYAAQVDENNDLAYEKNGVWFVPAFRMNGKKLDARGGIGITQEELGNFLKS
ncbi:MAG: DsbA family protein [Treponema sp.]|jgi:predicted DsbA family dithiol-disulfide isomerase|nr:DsbA family protein [Treponema sp.]